MIHRTGLAGKTFVVTAGTIGRTVLLRRVLVRSSEVRIMLVFFRLGQWRQ